MDEELVCRYAIFSLAWSCILRSRTHDGKCTIFNSALVRFVTHNTLDLLLPKALAVYLTNKNAHVDLVRCFPLDTLSRSCFEALSARE